MNEEIRIALVEYLGSRPAISQSEQTIFRQIKGEYPDLLLDDLQNAIIFLKNDGYIKEIHSEFGKTVYYQATNKSVLFVEKKYNI